MENKLLSRESLGLIKVMETLSSQNRELAVIFSESHHEASELDDDPDYVAIQNHIVQAIYRISELVGKNIAERII